MKRILSLLMLAVFVINMFAIGVYAESTGISINVNITSSTKEVVISGNIHAGPNKQVTAVVLNPEGGLDFIGQAGSGPEGSYEFRYIPENVSTAGVYKITIGGAFTNVAQSIVFELKAPGEVSNVSVEPGDSCLKIIWSNPPDSDFAGVNLYRDGILVRKVDKSQNSAFITGLTNGTTYTYILKTADAFGNEFEGMVARGVPREDIPVSTPTPTPTLTPTPTPTPAVAQGDNGIEKADKVLESIKASGITTEKALEAVKEVIVSISSVRDDMKTLAEEKILEIVEAILHKASTINKNDLEKVEKDNEIVVQVGKELVEKKLMEMEAVSKGLNEMLREAGLNTTADTAKKELKLDIRDAAKEDVKIELSVESINTLSAAGLDLVIDKEDVVFKVPPAALDVDEVSRAGTSVVLEIASAQVPEEKASVYIQSAYSNENEKLNPIGKLYSFTITAKGDAGEVKIESFKSKLTIELNYEGIAGINEDRLGVYRFNHDTGEWDYVGGKVDKEGMKVVFETGRFSIYTVMEYKRIFADMDRHWAKDDVEQMAAKHIAKGVDAVNFAPDTSITRAEFAAVLVRALGLEAISYRNSFSDVKAEDWYGSAVQTAWQAGLIEGYAGKFRPQEPITREEMTVLIIKAYSKASGKLPASGSIGRFSDREKISLWAAEYVKSACELGIISGVSDTEFAPSANASRAQAIVIIKRLLEKL